jgi:hypothetical protein
MTRRIKYTKDILNSMKQKREEKIEDVPEPELKI